MKKLICLFAAFAPALSGCAKAPGPGPVNPGPDKPFMNLSDKIEFDYWTDSKTLDVSTNVDDITCKPLDVWCEAGYENGTLTVSVAANSTYSVRKTTVELRGGGLLRQVLINQKGKEKPTSSDVEDGAVPVRVASSSCNNQKPGEEIGFSHDGLLETIYHSMYYPSVPVTPSAPAILTYNFENVAGIDYLVYNTRTDGSGNGNFREFDLYVATEEKPEPTLYKSFDLKGTGGSHAITFSPVLQKPTQIQFVVKGGISDHASCAEMQFFRKGPGNFDYTTVFTDATCSELKPGIGRPDIEKITHGFYKTLAAELFDGTYDTEFRVQNYRSWQHPDINAKLNKMGTYSLRDNPTGIAVQADTDLVVFAGDTHGQMISLIVQEPDKGIDGASYPLIPGVNKFKVRNSGLIYVVYYTQTGTEPDVKIHIASGTVNGYFDSQKHPAERWRELITKAQFQLFDLVGKRVHLTFETEAFAKYTTDGKALIDKYDELVRLEQELTGLIKYDRVPKNRMYCVVYHGDGAMYAGYAHTAYNSVYQQGILDVDKFFNESWGVAHEAGHIHQLRPGFNWHGLTETSVNLYSMYVQRAFGLPGWLIADVGTYGAPNRYTQAFKDILDTGISYLEYSHPLCRLVPFWQLKLYMHDVLGNGNFYPNVHETIRNNPDPPTEGHCQVEFVTVCCDAAGLDLTAFFEAWGFLKVGDITVDDYHTETVTVTQKMVNDAKAYIASKNYPKPSHDFTRITDANLSDYK